MRCKRHTVDFSSSIGVCASCLRERLFSLAASTAASEDNDPPPPPRPLVFPRSVSPYVSARKSSAGRGDNSLASSHNRFFPTPQVSFTGGGGSTSSEKLESGRSFKKKQSKLTRFSSLFRTRSEELRDSSDAAATFSPPSSSSSWLSKVLSFRSKKPSPNDTCYIEDLIASSHHHRPRQRYCRGMSPAGDKGPVDYDLEESPERVKRTPAIGTPGRRKTAAIGAGMGFCLSPLVRAKPNSNWKGKLPPEMKSPGRPHISTAASFCANRSKKLVDLGRVDTRR